MSDSTILITETKNGSASVSSVWTASSEAEFVSLVQQTFPRSEGVLDLETADQAASFLEERGALTVVRMDRQEFDGYTPDSFCNKVLAQAKRLGWYESESS